MKKIIRKFYPYNQKNYWEQDKIVNRFVEIVKSMPQPVFKIVSNATEDYVEAYNKNGVVAYRIYVDYFKCLGIVSILKKELKND